MIEKVKAITNPLTIIAIFAALAEIAGTVALSLVTPGLQVTFVWFVMLFPSFIVLLFFLTLNFNPKVLYAPSDFKNEENYLQAMYGVSKLQGNLEIIEQQLEAAKTQILKEAEGRISSTSAEQMEKLKGIINSQLSLVKSEINSTKESAVDLNLISFNDVPMSAQQARIMKVLALAKEPMTLFQLAETINVSVSATRRSLENMSRRGVLLVINEADSEKYALAKSF